MKNNNNKAVGLLKEKRIEMIEDGNQKAVEFISKLLTDGKIFVNDWDNEIWDCGIAEWLQSTVKTEHTKHGFFAFVKI